MANPDMTRLVLLDSIAIELAELETAIMDANDEQETACFEADIAALLIERAEFGPTPDPARAVFMTATDATDATNDALATDAAEFLTAGHGGLAWVKLPSRLELRDRLGAAATVLIFCREYELHTAITARGEQDAFPFEVQRKMRQANHAFYARSMHRLAG